MATPPNRIPSTFWLYNKGTSVLAYLGALVLSPILAAKNSNFARYHSNQGLVLLIAAVAYGVAYGILSTIIYAISWRLGFVVSIIGLVSILFTVLAIIGFINTVNGHAKKLPLLAILDFEVKPIEQPPLVSSDKGRRSTAILVPNVRRIASRQ